jgi:folate-dependent tRNA-U54 methylase TrmFO/GidA
MNANFGLVDPLPGKVKKQDRKPQQAARALEEMARWKAAL